MNTTTENLIPVYSTELKKAISKMPYYSEEAFLNDANAYINSIKNGSMLCIIHSVAKSGMSRTLSFKSCKSNGERFNYRNYNNLFFALGYKDGKNNEGFIIRGCGMDMVFNTNYNIIHDFYRIGLISKESCSHLAQQTPVIL